MDFSLTDEYQAVHDLAGQIFSGQLTAERFKALGDDRFDRALWGELARAGLLGISLPTEHGGAGLSFLATILVLEQAGRHAAPVPLLPTLVLGALPIARFGTTDQQARILPGVADGSVVVTAALLEPGIDPRMPAARAAQNGTGWLISGSKTCVMAGPLADYLLVPAATGQGTMGLFVVDARADGVTIKPLKTTSGSPEARVAFELVSVESGDVIGTRTGGAEIVDWITLHATAALCAQMAGVAKQAVTLTAEYAKTREQFDRPIATFQAVAQRLADAYIDAEGIALTSRQAAWRLAEGMDAAEHVAIAKFWAADAGQRVVHAAQHVHGGMGVDRDYPLHRYFLLAKQLELTLGGSTAQLLKLGRMLAAEPANV
ncbi:MAG: acyl-CoA dehydrogenase family protein [Acidimicrobiales bacterium]